MIQANAVIFDWGNTLFFDPFLHVLDSRAGEFLKILNDKGYPIDKQKLVDSWSLANNIHFPYGSHFMQEEKFIREALKNMGVNTDHIRIMWPKILEVYREGVEQMTGMDPRSKEIIEVLEFLKSKGKKIAIFSNERTETLHNWLKWANISEDYFHTIMASEEMEIEKPDPRFFLTMAETLEESSMNCVYVGDSPVKDIEPASALGMKTILLKVPEDQVSSEYKKKEYLNSLVHPDATITRISEIKDIIS